MPPRPKKRPGQPGGRRDANRRQRVADLQAAALQLFLADGVNAVSIDRIVRAAGMAKGSFHRYFDGKAALVASLMAPLTAGLWPAMDTAGRALEALADGGELDVAYVELGLQAGEVLLGHPHEVLLYLQENRGPAAGARVPIRALADELRRRSVELTEVAQRRGLLTDAIDPRVSGLAVVGAVERLLFEQLSGAELPPPLEVVDSLAKVVLDGMRPEP